MRQLISKMVQKFHSHEHSCTLKNISQNWRKEISLFWKVIRVHLKKHMHLLEEIGTDRLQYQDRLTMEICFEMRGQKLGQLNNNWKENYDSLGFDTAVSTAYIHENILLSFIFAVHDIVTNFPG